MKIYLIAGKAESGKTTFGNLLKEELEKKEHKACIMQITEPLYEYAKKCLNWNPDKDKKPREFLQKMGIEIIREKHNKKYFLLDRLNEDIEILQDYFDTFIITDVRFPEEIEYFERKYDNVCSIKINRNNHNNSLTEEEKNHITEKAIDNYNKFKYIIDNNNESQNKNINYIIENEKMEV